MDKRIFDVIGDIYSAPGDIAGWQCALESTGDLVGAVASAYFLVDGKTGDVDVSAFCGFPEKSVALYQGGGGPQMDVRFKYIHNLLPGKVFREFEFVPSVQEYDDSEWIQHQMKELAAYYCISSQISTHGLWRDYVSFNRLKSRGQNTDEEKAALQLLLPHYSRAAELHRIFTNLSNRYNQVLSVLDQLLVGLIILDSRKRIVIANSTAREVESKSSLFRFTPDHKLKVLNSNNNSELENLIESSCRTALKEGENDGGTIVLKCAKNFESLLLEIVPIRDDYLPDSDDIQGCAVFIIDPDVSKHLSGSNIAQIFGFTPAEEEVAGLLLGGLTVADIADHRNTTQNTIRWQLKRMFSKTNSSSQLDLFRLAAKLNPPIK